MTLISASTGGSLRSNDEHQSTSFDIGPGAFITDSYLTYAHRSESTTGHQIGIKHGFELAAIDQSGTPVALIKPITVTINYQSDELGSAVENTLQLYRLDGADWITQGVTSTLDAAGNLLTSLIDRLGRFAVLAETNRVFMPVAFWSLGGGW